MSVENKFMKIGSVNSESLSKKDREEITAKIELKPKETREEKTLLTKKVKRLKPITREINNEEEEITGVYLATLEGGSEAVFKTCDSSSHSENCSCSKSEASYLVDQALKFNLVPTTVTRDVFDEKTGETENGSMQDYTYNQGSGEDINLTPEELFKIRIFDYITGNYDRHEGNYISTSHGVKAIDNERSFSVEPEIEEQTQNMLTNNLREIENVTVPAEVLDIFEKLLKNLETLDKLEIKLSQLIGKKDAMETVNRIIKISETILKDEKLTEESVEGLMSEE